MLLFPLRSGEATLRCTAQCSSLSATVTEVELTVRWFRAGTQKTVRSTGRVCGSVGSFLIESICM